MKFEPACQISKSSRRCDSWKQAIFIDFKICIFKCQTRLAKRKVQIWNPTFKIWSFHILKFHVHFIVELWKGPESFPILIKNRFGRSKIKIDIRKSSLHHFNFEERAEKRLGFLFRGQINVLLWFESAPFSFICFGLFLNCHLWGEWAPVQHSSWFETMAPSILNYMKRYYNIQTH